MRVNPFARSQERTAIMPTSPVRKACVPPQGVRSNPSISINRNGPSREGSLRKWQAARFILGFHRRDRNRPIFPDDIVSQLNCAIDDSIAGVRQFHINLANLIEHAETARWRIEQGDECLRENVLAGVLLNMIETPRPIDPAR